MINRPTYSHIKESFEKEGYTLLSTEYINSKSKLLSLCSNGHKYEVSWNHWSSLGSRCKACYNNSSVNIEQVKFSFEEEGYILLSTEYFNNNTKLDYICPSGHIHSVTWGHWNTSKSRCPYCSNNMKHTIGEVRDILNRHSYTLLSSTYINNKSKIRYMCDKGHVNESTFEVLKGGHKCPYCANNVRLDISYIRDCMLVEGYELLSEHYKNNKTSLMVVCNRGHEYSTRWDSWSAGRRCPKCKGINISINRSGPAHPNWQGGKSFEIYCSEWKDKEYKKEIRERDGQICINPYCSKTDKRLSIHHIDYNKKNCRPSNLITVCGSCNAKANYDREWHTAWYRAILRNRYGYKY